MTHRCGSIAIVGRPNVGKSTLLNRFLGEKIAIVSPKPETTRDRLLGVLTLERAQILFIDTPGIYRGPKTLLAKHQVKEWAAALKEADGVVLMTEARAGWTEEDRQIVRLLPRGKTVFLAINKVDRVEKERLLPQIEEASRAHPFKEVFPISAMKGDNAIHLLEALIGCLPEGPALYPADQVTDKPARSLAQEIVREKALLFTHDEVPHAVAVLIEEWRAGQASQRSAVLAPQATYVRATLYVERESQKGIIIGKEGGLLKRIGQAARQEMEKLTNGPVFLDLWVKVAENWRKDPKWLKRFGYG
ncbi:MAG: GTPase Era [Candidatus Omnitrophica bacterium]|nr:GTPase Era [Candidatus Omnitrophota bacterium]